MKITVELTEDESIELASYIQARIERTRNVIGTLDVLIESLNQTGIKILVPGIEEKGRVIQKIRERDERVILVIDNEQAKIINEEMDKKANVLRHINDTIIALVECFEMVGIKLIIPGVTDVEEIEHDWE